ncbi:Histidine ammonia-lyase [hydrothermal vent metagenome]|uniref:Histidine ammonia-lyase n=1 Tax=hydrothermal vent metagenome TaxID=652676 RepID=A0A3B0XBM8_9ZZZZ
MYIYKTTKYHLLAITLVSCITTEGICMEKTIKGSVNIEQAIGMVKSVEHKKWLSEFMRPQDGASVFVEEHEAHYELIVTSPSAEKDYTGGTVQYLMDKKTGEVDMGWHEHPMYLPGEIVPEEIVPEEIVPEEIVPGQAGE